MNRINYVLILFVILSMVKAAVPVEDVKAEVDNLLITVKGVTN